MSTTPEKLKKVKKGLWNATLGEIIGTLHALEKRGITLDDLSRLRSDEKHADRVAEVILFRGDLNSIPVESVYVIMPDHFFGIEDWQTLGVDFSHKSKEFPWNESILNSICPLCGKLIKDCHFAFLVIGGRINKEPLTIMKLQEIFFQDSITSQPKLPYSGKELINEIIPSGWHLLHIEIIPDSKEKNFEDQKKMIPADYEIPLAVLELTKNLLYYKKTNQFANPSYYARCYAPLYREDKDNKNNENQILCVSGLFEEKITVSSKSSLGAYANIGIGAARKLPPKP